MTEVLVIGGGLAGLINAILLNRAGLKVVLVEKKSYPFHRVCGEYISNEVIPFLENQNLYPTALGPAQITELEVSAVSGRQFLQPLELGGFGISRYAYDHWLSEIAKAEGVLFHENTTVLDVLFREDHFETKLSNGEIITSQYVIGAFGKRTKLDQQLDRSFLKRRSPYMGVKYHLKGDFPSHRISLHNFEGGYCGISMVEDSKFNLCYLSRRKDIKTLGSIKEFEQQVLRKNPSLDRIFSSAEFLMEQPEVINEISFDKMEPIHQHIFMCGDAAGMITPLCGNGMAMAIRSAVMLSKMLIGAKSDPTISRLELEEAYSSAWKNSFSTRLWFGRKLQNLFGEGTASDISVRIGRHLKPVSKFLIRQTHGSPFS
ncbi:NAD(P)/FAD-dependent oxidoreductase [Marinoscillum sp. MHG1-6]|uniref:NAD(P)/FAD-dependent oxidoreductase n=1 Tax=Marinoscillum sp. MHG1-6 TaxID=2959627 RepID=UPI002157B126|nr:NAD(P)/FAD-dependent oxidoreductase [Marinoscillum sp. MHG1-6]